MFRWVSCCVWVGCGGAPGKSVVEEPVASEGQFTVLTYNVHGLPSLITGDDTPGRMTQIAPRLGAWDILGVQEDWDGSNHEELISAVDHETRLWFDDAVLGRVYGSGLATLARFSMLSQEGVHFSTCEGTLDGASDCLASKGFQMTRIAVGTESVDVYNTHLEAGGSAADHASRQTQVQELLTFMAERSAGRAIVFTGDFNLHALDMADAELLARLTDEGGLTDACDAVDCLETEHIDRVWVRSSDAIQLVPTGWSNVSADFLDEEGVDLSDHPPISVSLMWDTQ
jgi:endonuclease/exonuclease/phosphatase family metal-dependent hydrolase